MSDDGTTSSSEKQEEPPAWAPPGWEVPAADPSVPPYGAPPGWQPPLPPPSPYGGPPGQYPPGYGQPTAPPGSASGWHGAGVGGASGYPPHSPPPQPYGQQGYPPPYSSQSPYGQQSPYGAQPYGGYPRPGDTNGYAIASLVCSLVGVLVVIVGPGLGILFGILGLRQLNSSGQSGRGLAIAGIVIGSIVLLLDLIGIISLAVGGSDSSGGNGLSTLHAAHAVMLFTASRSSA